MESSKSKSLLDRQKIIFYKKKYSWKEYDVCPWPDYGTIRLSRDHRVTHRLFRTVEIVPGRPVKPFTAGSNPRRLLNFLTFKKKSQKYIIKHIWCRGQIFGIVFFLIKLQLSHYVFPKYIYVLVKCADASWVMYRQCL